MTPNFDPFHSHEVLDRAHLMASMWADFIEKHPLVAADEELREKAETIGELIGRFYQLVGERTSEEQ
ncbi:hypothetical protein [Altericroceibacterium xinjiangense]|uniref:hypothetical protein n=1 Tax=Altericroceibacterium xinjiangense TaxID=762261 RepID=UPI000F7F419B|nr:hypothetical protein [Altericroceibacterium xinjiangense]